MNTNFEALKMGPLGAFGVAGIAGRHPIHE